MRVFGCPRGGACIWLVYHIISVEEVFGFWIFKFGLLLLLFFIQAFLNFEFRLSRDFRDSFSNI